jgi:antitoxin component YwqK of YwqJK toxin-antitoxin module
MGAKELVDFIYVDRDKIKMEGKYITSKSEREDDKLFFEEGYLKEGYLEFNIENIEKSDYKEFWSNRQIKVQGQYKSGQKSGKWLYYNKDGKLLKEVGYMKDKYDKYFEYYSIQY